MEGFAGDLLRAQRDEKSGGWVYRSLKANNFSGENVSYRQFLLVVKTLGNFLEQEGWLPGVVQRVRSWWSASPYPGQGNTVPRNAAVYRVVQ